MWLLILDVSSNLYPHGNRLPSFEKWSMVYTYFYNQTTFQDEAATANKNRPLHRGPDASLRNWNWLALAPPNHLRVSSSGQPIWLKLTQSRRVLISAYPCRQKEWNSTFPDLKTRNSIVQKGDTLGYAHLKISITAKHENTLPNRMFKPDLGQHVYCILRELNVNLYGLSQITQTAISQENNNSN